MRLLAFSDLHCDLDACARIVAVAPQADLVLGCGDFASARQGLAPVIAALAPLGDKAIFLPGNNESFAELTAACSGTGITVLHGGEVTRQGLRILALGGGIPPLPPIPWPSWDLDEAEAEAALAPFVAADILALHSPPFGVADRGARGHLGSPALRRAIERLQPRLALCGHIHESWGARGQIGVTTVANLGPTANWFQP